MEPSEQLVDEIYREKVARARRMTPVEKLLAGPELFDFACEWARAGIRLQCPQADEREVLRILQERVEREREAEGKMV